MVNASAAAGHIVLAVYNWCTRLPLSESFQICVCVYRLSFSKFYLQWLCISLSHHLVWTAWHQSSRFKLSQFKKSKRQRAWVSILSSQDLENVRIPHWDTTDILILQLLKKVERIHEAVHIDLKINHICTSDTQICWTLFLGSGKKKSVVTTQNLKVWNLFILGLSQYHKSGGRSP